MADNAESNENEEKVEAIKKTINLVKSLSFMEITYLILFNVMFFHNYKVIFCCKLIIIENY